MDPSAVKVAKGLFQYTATDDCMRMRVLALYPRRTAKMSVRFLHEHVLKEFPFPIQRIHRESPMIPSTVVESSLGWNSNWR